MVVDVAVAVVVAAVVVVVGSYHPVCILVCE